MNGDRSGRLALGVSVAIAVLAAIAIVLSLFALDQAALPSTILACIAAGAAFGPIGALIVRHRGNAVGWTLLGVGSGVALSTVTLEYGGLSFSVTDDGGGFDTTQTRYGTGLQGMADRLSALGGTLEVESQSGEGTTVTGHLPTS